MPKKKTDRPLRRPITVFIDLADRNAMRRISNMHGIPQSRIVRELLADAFALMRADKLPKPLQRLKQSLKNNTENN